MSKVTASSRSQFDSMNGPDNLGFDKKDAQENPLTFVGYRVFSRWLATDQNFLVVRRFSVLAARTALCLQDRLTDYEEQLDQLDIDATRRKENIEWTNNGTLRNDVLHKRCYLVQNIIPKALKDYYSFMNEYSQFANHPRAQSNDIQDVRRWFTNHNTTYKEDPVYHNSGIDALEAAYIVTNHADDLVLIQPKDKSPMRYFLERTFFLRIKGLSTFFELKRDEWGKIDPTDVPDEKRKKTLREYFHWRSGDGEKIHRTYSHTMEGKFRKWIESWRGYRLACLPFFETPEAREARKARKAPVVSGYTVWANDKHIDNVAAYITVFMSLGMLTGPLWVLNYVQGENSRLGVITCFIAGFYIMVSAATTAKPSETIAAVAAYSAVLTVFLTLSAASK